MPDFPNIRKSPEARQPRSARRPSRLRRPTDRRPRLGRPAWPGHRARHVGARRGPDLASLIRLDLLDLRAESFIAQGDLERAAADADAMLDLAERSKNAAFKAQARNRLALAQLRKGELKAALATATAALKAARASKQGRLEAMSLYRLAEVQFRNRVDLREVRGPCDQSRRVVPQIGRSRRRGPRALGSRRRACRRGPCHRSGQGRERRLGAVPAGR